MKKTLALTCVITLLSGCATRTMSTQDIQQFKGLSLKQFVIKRFVDTEKDPALVTGITNVLDKSAAFANNIHKNAHSTSYDSQMRMRQYKVEKSIEDFNKKTTGILDGNSVIFEASFTGVNYVQLIRPIKELTSFCKVQGGNLKLYC